MKYLFDTCVISDFVKGDLNTIEKIKSTSPLQIGTSAITEYELRYGLEKNSNLKRAIKDAVLGFLNDVVILPFGSKESIAASNIRASLEKAGTPIGAYDILIASTAIANNLILVTSNEREFERIQGIQIENWRYEER
ncbi:tRNA(fMet)-specific endonuclease VapC [Ekhidna lutea]|uniref:tRNA(fMet)-specific endonuclease VapC n=1 Tax=Ekhidna lutea TaxID=447679 RepID=A0A239KGF6_EKHLU|nr:type II toxin-antitoxin system VapC family toxin [Ekhidna lutea]SNT17145.1 tRNA(fMet)-specific endonuclease VapC [Ekhidna lutea]